MSARVTVGGSTDWVRCSCGNDPRGDGFYPSTRDGLDLEDEAGRLVAGLEGDDWAHVKCAACGAVFNIWAIEAGGPGSTVPAVPSSDLTDGRGARTVKHVDGTSVDGMGTK